MKYLTIEAKSKTDNRDALILVTSSTVLTLLLFYIDEEHYNFNWVSDVFAWLIFCVYFIIILFANFLVYTILPKKLTGVARPMLSLVLGAAVGLAFLIGAIF